MEIPVSNPVPCLTASCLPNGNDANDLALHFNPRFHDNLLSCFVLKAATVYRKKCRPIPSITSYIRIGGDFKLTSLKISK
uniref:Uncharacterized protein n=1 Tax=Takifugu rubripes TaxID=31033 RepID=A0A674MJP4_TAKRU